MFNIILVILGILMFVYAVIQYRNLWKLVYKTSLKKWWLILLVLIVLFGVGYIVFAYILITNQQIGNLPLLERVVSYVFFFGAIFVIITTHLIYFALRGLQRENRKTKRILTELEKSKSNVERQVTERTAQLEKANKFMTDRELKMVELKKEIQELKNK